MKILKKYYIYILELIIGNIIFNIVYSIIKTICYDNLLKYDLFKPFVCDNEIIVLTDKMMKEKKVKSKMLIQVHDELIFDVALDEIEMMKAIILEGMENAMSLKVKLKASYAVGNSWYEAK